MRKFIFDLIICVVLLSVFITIFSYSFDTSISDLPSGAIDR